jgi:glycosyltransferase involved in cell wall biosynthesis
VLAPHGSLEPWALLKSSRKKALALSLFEGKNLREASCLHATSAAEIGDFRKFGLKGPIALIPNGVSGSWLQSTGEEERFREKFGIPKERRIAFFLSRITPKKGLPMLLDAWADHRDRLRDWCLVIAGSDEFSHLSALVAHVEAASLSDSVIFLGPLYGTDKRDAFAASDVFVLPSHGEGAPMAVLDALGAGVPVLTTQRTPWEDLCRHRCGWWVPDNAGPIGEALVDISLRSREDLVSWGSRGKDLVSLSYSWKLSADKCNHLYSWLLGLAERPQYVHTD